MTRFLDGPAAGAQLLLRRAPLFLRVTQNPRGRFDALDQVADDPQADETISVYQRVTAPTSFHVDGYRRKEGRIAEWFQGADYRAVAPTPDERILRNRELWQLWCRQRKAQEEASPS